MENCKIGYIYKIICNHSNDVYVGSTFNRLSDRLRQHISHYSIWSSGTVNEVNEHVCVSIYPYFEKYGVSNFTIVPIKQYEVIDRKHLMMYEQIWINKLKCVNKHAAFNPLNQSGKLRYHSNKARINDWKSKNKDKIDSINQRYREKNRDKISEKVECACGGTYSKQHKARHFKTARHLKKIAA